MRCWQGTSGQRFLIANHTCVWEEPAQWGRAGGEGPLQARSAKSAVLC